MTTTSVQPTTTDEAAVERWKVAVWNNAVWANAVKHAEARAVLEARASKAGEASAPRGYAPAASRPSGSSCSGIVAVWIGEYFPPADQPFFLSVAWRESRCTLGAFNAEGCDTSGRTNSHAYGPLQVCLPLHDEDMAAVGCGGQYRNDECVVKAAAHLAARDGRGPWGG